MDTTDRPLVLPYPMRGELVRTAVWNLHLSEKGTEEQKEWIGPSEDLPRPWDLASCTDPDHRREGWEWYEAFVTWFNHEYVWDPAPGMIPPCWPLHPHLVHEIGVLADQRRVVGLATDSNALEEWHRCSVPGFLERLRGRITRHRDQRHQAWPARARSANRDETRRSGQ